MELYPFAAKTLSSVLKAKNIQDVKRKIILYICNDAFDWMALIRKMEWDVCF